MTTEEGNRIIAPFDGNEWLGDYGYHNDIYYSQAMRLPDGDIIEADYHENWSRLMPVVEKIETLDSGRFEFRISTLGVDVYDYSTEDQAEIVTVPRYDKERKIELTHDAVIQFIQWHNQAKA